MADGLYLFHGILMGAAWFFFAPLAIVISIARRCAKKDSLLHQDGLWYNIHFYCALTAVLFTIIGFIIVFVGGDDDDDDRRTLAESPEDDGPSEVEGSEDGVSSIAFGLSEDAADDIHKKLGIAILALALFQAFLGFIRPSAFKNTSQTDTFQKPQPGEDDPTFVGNVEIISQPSEGDLDADREQVYGVAPEQIAARPATPKKSMLRLIWEWSHRLLGITIVIVAWVECTIGITMDD